MVTLMAFYCLHHIETKHNVRQKHNMVVNHVINSRAYEMLTFARILLSQRNLLIISVSDCN
ncbi:hypothetical protein HanXRQr2_Chr12g0522661 [Helianthus annuus]|uniref:Uncharacterized protein n=1 Tax=Helianthus annuus TaxID=4232 RepID=A0A9K3HEF8_HELAN|nr:hypothetical protein HanXRQr2_Chr12g0522661 [Helianthus annuus]